MGKNKCRCKTKNNNDSNEKSFINSVKNEWKNGWSKLIGWSIPITILTAILVIVLQPIMDLSLKVDIDKWKIVEDNSVLSQNNPRIEGGEYQFDNTGNFKKIKVDKQMPKIIFTLEGKGIIDKAFYFYKLDQFEKQDNHIYKYELDVNHGILNRILQRFQVSPSTLELPTNINIRVPEGEYSRSYLVLRDSNNTSEYKIFLIYIRKSKSIKDYEIEVISEKKIYQTSPSKYKTKDDNKLHKDLENIQNELKEIYLMLNK